MTKTNKPKEEYVCNLIDEITTQCLLRIKNEIPNEFDRAFALVHLRQSAGEAIKDDWPEMKSSG